MEFGGLGTQISENISRSNHGGFYITGSYNNVERNLVTDCSPIYETDAGLVFSEPSSGNVYGLNVVRGCTQREFLDEGTGNTSRGDNYMPTQM